jgi:hypothetical protein
MLGLVLPLSVLVACSSGGGIGGTGATGVTVGPITGFGSIVVNGVHMDISNATVNLEGVPGDPSNPNVGLKLGMVVVVRGDFSPDGLTGVAASVEYEDSLEGPVDSVDVAGNQLTVLDHTVVVNTSTVFDGFSALGELIQGNMVEVSGLVDAGGNIVAARIELKGLTFGDVGELEIKGTISNLDPQAMTFNIGSLQVDYGSVQPEHLPSGGLTDGLFVEVKSTQPPSGGTILASEVEVKRSFSDSLGEEGDHVEIEGFVTEFSSLDQPFKVNGVPIRTTATTQYEHGLSGDVANGVRLEVEGLLDADGVLVAVKVELEDSSGEDSSTESGDDL